MNFTVNSTVLKQELRLINQIVPDKSALPILSNVRVEAELNRLSFYTTDLEIGFKTACAATVTEPGHTTLPAKHLLDIVEQLPDADVQMVMEKARARLSCRAFKSQLHTLPVEDFPHVPEVSGDSLTLAAPRFQMMIHQVRHAISDKLKFTVNGALLTIKDNVMALVSTDGKRLSLTTAHRPADINIDVVVPAKTLDAVLALFNDTETFVFSYNGKHLFFVADDRILVSRTFERDFPNYQRIIPQANDKCAIIERNALTAALRRVGLLADETQAVVLTFEPQTLLITSSNASAGDALEQLSVNYDGPVLKVCVNHSHVLDFLNVASEPTVTVNMKDAMSPLLLSDGPSFINVVMTMRSQ